ncbi:MAG: phosphocholine cytidylyltransferase family protein [Candidatus Baldrarchaeia archaeon]
MLSEAVILAAGMGTRLSIISNQRPKFLVKVLGWPLIFFPILMLISIGIFNINIVVPKGWKSEAEQTLRKIKANFQIIENDEPQRDNGYSFLLSKQIVSSDKFLLTMCDHILPPSLVSTFINNSPLDSNVHVLVAGDKSPRYIDVCEATRILTAKDDNVIKIGKNLPTFDYIDIGLFIIDRKTFKVAEDLASKKYVIRLSDVINELLDRNFIVKVIDITGNPWTEIDTVNDYFSAHTGKRREVIDIFLKEVEKCGIDDKVNGWPGIAVH